MFATNITGSYVNSCEQAKLTGVYDRTFQTFARNIIVYKQPIEQKLITGPNNPGLFGFGDGQVATQLTYTAVSGVYPAIVRYVNTKRNISAIEVIQESNTMSPIGEVTIKVRPDCWDFIENSGVTDKFLFDGRDFYFASKYKAMPFLGALYYEYQLKPKP